jgi:uncharacterized protein YecT (DUF1311 family)
LEGGGMKTLTLILGIAVAISIQITSSAQTEKSLSKTSSTWICPKDIKEINNEEWCEAYEQESLHQKADVELNRVYKIFMAPSDSEADKNFMNAWRQSQRAWLPYIESNCKAMNTISSGAASSNLSSFHTCMLNEKIARAVFLNKICNSCADLKKEKK